MVLFDFKLETQSLFIVRFLHWNDIFGIRTTIELRLTFIFQYVS